MRFVRISVGHDGFSLMKDRVFVGCDESTNDRDGGGCLAKLARPHLSYSWYRTESDGGNSERNRWSILSWLTSILLHVYILIVWGL